MCNKKIMCGDMQWCVCFRYLSKYMLCIHLLCDRHATITRVEPLASLTYTIVNGLVGVPASQCLVHGNIITLPYPSLLVKLPIIYFYIFSSII